MPRLVYGLFPDRELAEAAKTSIHEQAQAIEEEREAASIAVHEYEVRPDDLPGSGTFAKRAALAGGMFVGACVGVMLGLLMGGVFASVGGPATIVGSDPVDVVLVTIAAGVFGAVVTGIGGTAGNRAKLRELERQVAEGDVLVTLEAPKSQVPAIIDTMLTCGALRTGSI